MTDTLLSDVSEFQTGVNDSYPYRFISIRSNDGTYRDRKFADNLAWAKSAVARGRLDGFIVYFVYEPNWQETVATFKAVVGAPHPKMAVMIDVENWNGRISGDHSNQINATRQSVINWLGGSRRRVFGYGNKYDLANIWPTRGDSEVIVASYGAVPTGVSGMLGHQFASNYQTSPFGASDINRISGMAPAQFAAHLGLVSSPTPPAKAGHNPTGHVDSFRASGRPLRAQGWAIDADSPASPVVVHIYQDDHFLKGITTTLVRADVNKSMKVSGKHGFDVTLNAPTGAHTYKFYAINIGGGTNVLLGTYKV